MKALIFENKVIDVQTTEFEVAPTMTWVDCDNTVKIGFSFDGTTFTSDKPTAEKIAAYEAEQKTKTNNKTSAVTKLKALGLNDEEIKSLGL